MARELNQQQLLFCHYYALYGGGRGAGTRAAKAAEYSKTNANHSAAALLKRQDIRERIEVEKKILTDKVEMESSEIIKRYQDMARKKGDYGQATVTEAERALKQLGKYKNMQGFAEKVIIEQKVPYDDWTLEELRELKRTGKVPRGKKVSDIRAISGYLSGVLSEESGENLN